MHTAIFLYITLTAEKHVFVPLKMLKIISNLDQKLNKLTTFKIKLTEG